MGFKVWGLGLSLEDTVNPRKSNFLASAIRILYS